MPTKKLPKRIRINLGNDSRVIGLYFVEALNKDLTQQEMVAIAKKNKTYGDECCATHDYCDANVYMDRALRRFYGCDLFKLARLTYTKNEEREGLSAAACEIWDVAWRYGKTLIRDTYLPAK